MILDVKLSIIPIWIENNECLKPPITVSTGNACFGPRHTKDELVALITRSDLLEGKHRRQLAKHRSLLVPGFDGGPLSRSIL